MEGPSKCKWCGAGDARLRLNGWKVFQCGANYHVECNHWTHGDTCADRLRDSIWRATEALKRARRFSLDVEGLTLWSEPDPEGEWVRAESLEQVLKIMQGDPDGDLP